MIYVTRETHQTPPEVERRVTCAGGLNRFDEPNFRVVWGGSRLTLVGGRWTDRDAHGNVVREVVELRRVPKYLPVERWHIERWMPPEAYGLPDDWHARTIEVEDGARIPALGPYPLRGEYEHCFTLENQRGEFVALTPTACDWIVRAIDWALRQSVVARRAALAKREEGRERDWDRRLDDILNDTGPRPQASAP